MDFIFTGTYGYLEKNFPVVKTIKSSVAFEVFRQFRAEV